MTGIDGLGRLTGPGAGQRARPTRGGFSVPDRAEPRAAETAVAAGIGWTGMLALQEAEGDAVADREAKRRGQDLLAELAALQRALLGPRIDPRGLERLAELTAHLPRAGDPALRAAVAAVALRARVELARWASIGSVAKK